MTIRIRGFVPALVLSAALGVGSLPALAQSSSPAAQDEHSGHHPEAGQATAPAIAPPTSPQVGMGMMGMMGGGGMGRMMPMMPGAGMMGGMPFERIEGRLAFLKAELHVTDAQLPQWSNFADAFRAVAKDARGMHEEMTRADSAAPQTSLTRLDAYERMLTVRLAAVRTIKAAYAPLYASFSDEQKKTADELAPHMGML
jgi:hypothetical protein